MCLVRNSPSKKDSSCPKKVLIPFMYNNRTMQSLCTTVADLANITVPSKWLNSLMFISGFYASYKTMDKAKPLHGYATPKRFDMVGEVLAVINHTAAVFPLP